MANKNAEKKTAKANAIAVKKHSDVKKTAAAVYSPKEDKDRHPPRPQSKKDSHQDIKKDIKKDRQKNSIAAAHRKDNKTPPFLLLFLFLAVLFLSVYHYVSSNFSEEIKQSSPSPKLVNNERPELGEKEKEVQRLNSELANAISDQVQGTLKRFDESENSQEFRKYLLLLKEDSNISKEEAKLNKKVLLDFEKEKKSCRENLVTRAKSLQTKFETDFEILSRSIKELDIFKNEALVLYENCRKDLANLVEKANDSYDKLSAKIKNEAEKVEDLNKLQKDKEEVKRITGRFYNYVENKTQEILTKINQDFEEGTKAKNRQQYKEIIYNFESRKFKLLDKITTYHHNLKKSFEKDLDELLKKRNPNDFEEKVKELFESYRKKLSDFAKKAIDENYKIIKIMQKNISQVEKLTTQDGDENIDDEPWIYGPLVPLVTSVLGFLLLRYPNFCITKIEDAIGVINKVINVNIDVNGMGPTLIFIFLFFLTLFLDFIFLAIKKYGKKSYFERLFYLFSKHLWHKIILLTVLMVIGVFCPDEDCK